MADCTRLLADRENGDIRRIAFAMETELNILRGVLIAYRTFAAQPDPVEPVAIAVLGRLGEEALERLTDQWRAMLPNSSSGK